MEEISFPNDDLSVLLLPGTRLRAESKGKVYWLRLTNEITVKLVPEEGMTAKFIVDGSFDARST